MDGMTERVKALRELLGPDVTQQLLNLAQPLNEQTTKAAGLKTTYKAASPLDDALDALEEWLEAVETDANSKTLADQVTAFTVQLQKQLTATPIKRPAKTTDAGPQSVATKSTQPPESFFEWMTPGRAHQ